MKVKAYDYRDGRETYRGTFDLADLIDLTEDRYEAWRHLREVGRYWTGSDPVNLTYLQRVD